MRSRERKTSTEKTARVTARRASTERSALARSERSDQLL